jgi:hypothetical protein
VTSRLATGKPLTFFTVRTLHSTCHILFFVVAEMSPTTKNLVILSLVFHIVAAYIYYCIVRYGMARLLCTEICGEHAKKSSKWFYDSAPKVEQVYLQSLTCLTSSCAHQIYFFTCLLLQLNNIFFSFLQAAALFYMILVIVVVGINIGSSNIRHSIFNNLIITKNLAKRFSFKFFR